MDYADRNGHIVRIEKLVEGLLPTLPNQFYGEKEVVINLSDFDNKKTKIIIIIGGIVLFQDSEITDLGQLTTIYGDTYFRESQITDLGKLTTICGDANFKNSQITDLGQLTTICGGANFKNSQITDLGNLQTIGGNASFNDSQVTNLGNLQTIGGYADFKDSQVTNLGNLQKIGTIAYFNDSQVTSLGNLTTIGGNAYFNDSQVTDLGNLTTIGGNASFNDSQVTDLGNLTKIGGSAYFTDSKITDLGNLTKIGGSAIFGKRKDLEKMWNKIKYPKKVVNSESKYAKGGSVIAYKKDYAKFNKIGITDKYEIEAITEIGLQGINFDKKSIEGKITQSFNDLLKEANTNEYIISEDSEAITNSIQNDIRARYNQGDTEENIREYQQILNNNSKRKELYIDKYAESQKETINEWISYLKQSEYPVAIKYLLLKSVLNFNYDYKTNVLIKRTAKTIRNFTPFDAGSLSELIPMNSDYLLKDYTQIQVSNAVNVLRNNELAKTSSGGTWLKFDGGSKTDSKKREENSKELSKLVQNTYWCTKTNAKSQLDGGDFYVYVTENNGEVFPRIAIRMDEDKVGEVRGNKSSAQDLEDDMIPIAKEFLENNLDNDSGKKWLDGIDYNQKALDLYNKLNSEGLFKNSIEGFIELKSKEQDNLLDYADRNGHIVRIEKLIEEKIKYLPNEFYKKDEIVFDFSDFIPKLTRIILGNADFRYSEISNLGKLTSIGGNTDFSDSQVTDLGNLTTIGGDAYFRNSQVTSLGKLIKIGNGANFQKSQITSLGNLTSIGDFAYFNDSKITDLGNLTTIGGDAKFQNSQITDLGNLTSIGGDVSFINSQVTDLGNLQTIGSNADFRDSIVTDLGNLKTIGGGAIFKNSQITDLGNLQTIGGYADFINSQVTDLGNLTSIGGNADFPYSKITNLGNLKTIGGNADFRDSIVTDLGNLKTIGGGAIFKNSQITDLGNLQTIGGYADFINSQVTDLGNLTSIGGNADFPYSKITNLGNLQTIGGYADFRDSIVTDLGNLTSIGGYANFRDSKLTDLGNLTSIYGNAYFEDSQLTDLGNLTKIGGNAYFRDSKVTNLGNLTTIGGYTNFFNSQVTDLGNLTSIGGNAYFRDSKLTDLGKLTTIGGDADFKDSQLTDLGNLQTIGGYADFQNSKITDLGNLTTIGDYANFGDRLDLKEMWDKRNSPKKFETIESKYAKGGKVVVLPADIQKYKKIGIEDKYFIEASKDVGLQGINFDLESVSKRIKEQFNYLLDSYEDYLINEDSPSITNYINNEIETHKEQGSSLETIQRFEQMKDNEYARRTIIDDIAKTQKESLDKWIDYLRLSEYKLPFKFLILKAVLNFNYDLKQNKLFERGNTTIRNYTPFDAGSLAELNEKNSDFLLMDYNIIMNENSSKILNSQEVVEQSGNGKWIKFNGGRKTKPEDIEKNGNRLMNLVQNTYWCTKSAGTSQLRGGDFYVYVTESNGEIFPRIAVRMNEDKVGEVRGNKSSAQDLDAEMLPIAEEFLNKNIPNDSGKKWLDSIKYNKKCVEMRKRFEAEGMYKDFIYDYIKLIADKEKYRVDYGANGNVTLLEQKLKEIIQVTNEYYEKGDIVNDYRLLSPSTIYYIGNMGYFELSRLNLKFSDLTKLKLISGDLSLASNDEITDLGNIEYVGGDVSLINQFTDKNTSIGKLKYIGGALNFNFANVESLNNLESVGGILVLKRITKDLGKLKKVGGLQINSCDDNFSLGMLEEIEGDLQILNFSVDINFGNLKTIGGSLVANNTIITDLKNLESVGGDFNIAGSKIKKFEKLKTIGGNADFSNNFCSSTQNIETILGNIKFLNSRIMEFPKLNKIGGTIEFRGSYFKSFGNIKYIGGNLNFADSKIEELGDLEYVGGYVSFKGSKIKTLNKLKKIVGFANFDGSEVQDLGDLESVGGNIYLNLTKIKSLGKLNYVGGLVMMKKDNYKFSDINYDLISEQLKK